MPGGFDSYLFRHIIACAAQQGYLSQRNTGKNAQKPIPAGKVESGAAFHAPLSTKAVKLIG